MFVNYNVFAIIGSYITSQYLDDNDYEGIKDSGEMKSSDDNYDDVENPDSEEQTFEKSVDDFKMDRSHYNWAKKVSDPFRRPRSRRPGGRRRRRRLDKSRVILATVKKDCRGLGDINCRDRSREWLKAEWTTDLMNKIVTEWIDEWMNALIS